MPKDSKGKKINTVYTDLNSNEIIFRININFMNEMIIKIRKVF